MQFMAHLYAGTICLGQIESDTFFGLKQIASRKCNGYFRPYDKMELFQINGESSIVHFYRRNKLSPDNKIVWGKWE